MKKVRGALRALKAQVLLGGGVRGHAPRAGEKNNHWIKTCVRLKFQTIFLLLLK